jgi:predicted acylesterase/phospholipase RssA
MSGGDRRAARSRGATTSRRGLALAGGGPAGAVWEIGALRALDEALDGIEFTMLDSYVGVSAGAVLAACLANGISSEEMVHGILATHGAVQPFTPDHFFVPAYREWARRALRLPVLLAGAVRDAVAAPGDISIVESLTRLARAVPVAVFDNAPLRAYFADLFGAPRTDDFRRLDGRLTIIAADLESARPIRFGGDGWEHIPISRAIQASTALPGLYPPVVVEGRRCVDGALLKTVHASVALEDGVDLLFCINPIVPVDTTPAVRRGEMTPGVLEEGGLPVVLSQTFRTLVHSRMEVGMGAYATRFPNADVVLFEPARDQYEMFFSNIFSFRARRDVCELAYRATRRDLLERRHRLEPLLARHGITLRVDLLEEDRSVWGLHRPTGRESTGEVLAELSSALDALDAQVSGARAS